MTNRAMSVLFTALLLIAAPVALADGNSTLTLTSPGSNVMGGVYVGPYTFTVNSGGQSSQLELVCDDFKDEVFPGESWQALLSTLPTLNNVGSVDILVTPMKIRDSRSFEIVVCYQGRR